MCGDDGGVKNILHKYHTNNIMHECEPAVAHVYSIVEHKKLQCICNSTVYRDQITIMLLSPVYSALSNTRVSGNRELLADNIDLRIILSPARMQEKMKLAIAACTQSLLLLLLLPLLCLLSARGGPPDHDAYGESCVRTYGARYACGCCF